VSRFGGIATIVSASDYVSRGWVSERDVVALVAPDYVSTFRGR